MMPKYMEAFNVTIDEDDEELLVVQSIDSLHRACTNDEKVVAHPGPRSISCSVL